MEVESYEKATGLIVIVNQALMLRNFVDRKKNKLKYICSWIFIVSFVALFHVFVSVEQYFYFRPMSLDMRTLLYAFTFMFVTYGYVAIVSISLYNSQAASKLAARINNVDETLKKLGAKIEYRNLFRRVIIVLSLWTVNTIAVIALTGKIWFKQNMDSTQFFLTLCYTYIMYTASIVLFEYNVLVYWLGLKFEQANELLATFFSENSIITVQPASNFPDRNQLCGGLFGKVHAIEQIRLVHLRLCSMSKILNGIFERQILIFVYMALNYLLATCYSLYLKLSEIDENRYRISAVTAELLLFFVDATYNFVKLVIVSYNCERTTNRANRAIDIVHISPYDADPALKDEIVQFSLQISYVLPGKSKSTSFWLNYRYVHQCAGYLLTNFILMIQWSSDTVKED